MPFSEGVSKYSLCVALGSILNTKRGKKGGKKAKMWWGRRQKQTGICTQQRCRPQSVLRANAGSVLYTVPASTASRSRSHGHRAMVGEYTLVLGNSHDQQSKFQVIQNCSQNVEICSAPDELMPGCKHIPQAPLCQ